MTHPEPRPTCQGDACDGCTLDGDLNCRFKRENLIRFIATVFPFIASAVLGLYIVGTVTGSQLTLIAYAAYYAAFFLIIEPLILCRHCPHYATEGPIIRCHANYGLPRLWAYDPRPMNPAERAGVIIGFTIFGLYPIAFEAYGLWYLFFALGFVNPPGGLLLTGVTLVTAASAAALFILLRRNYCNRCVNFGCPLNATPSRQRMEYLKRNPGLASLWSETA